MRFTATSSWTWVGHPVSGLTYATLRSLKTRFPCGSTPSVLNLAAYINSPDRSTKSTISSFNALYVLVNARFQVLFHSPSGVLFTFPSQYCFSIGHRLVFRLRGWSPYLHYGFLVSVPTSDPGRFSPVSPTRLSLPSVGLPMPFGYIRSCFLQSITPKVFLLLVSPLSLSLAATRKISFDFFSSAYLDVSVRQVPRIYLCVQYTLPEHVPGRVAPFGYLRL